MRAGFASLMNAATEALWAQHPRLFQWSVVAFATGIGIYFAPSTEPSLALWVGVPTLAGLGLVVLGRGQWRAVALALSLVAAGFCLAGLRAHRVAAPVLTHAYFGPVQGRVIAIDRSASDKLRLTLDQVRLRRVPPDETPARVRLSLHGETPIVPRLGDEILTAAYLAPPAGRAEPGGFDFRRHAWFVRIGAQGYTRTAVLRRSDRSAVPFLMRLRALISERLRAGLDDPAGGVAAALITGDRSGVGQSIIEDLRVTNLAHLLAISGLHMGLVVGLAFGVLRFVLALSQSLTDRLNTKKLAAAAAIVVALFYERLSGGSVATERACIMAVVVLLAVLFDRRALSLRLVALAAWGVLLLRPESLLSPGFQMSFAATTALVWVFNTPRGSVWTPQNRALRMVFQVSLCSAVAGLATAPVSAAHFNQLSAYGLIANLSTVPLMGGVIMPAGVAAVVLMPFGLEHLPLWLMGQGIDWIVSVAGTIADWPGARRLVVRPPAAVLPLIALFGLMLILWDGRLGRGLAGLGLASTLVLWSHSDRPHILVADGGGLVGVMTPQGRALSAARGDGFTARLWLENDGDPADQQQAAARWQAATQNDAHPPIIALRGKRAVARFDTCSRGTLIVTNHPLERSPPCQVLGPQEMAETGPVALVWTGTHWVARASVERRLWSAPLSTSGSARSDAPER